MSQLSKIIITFLFFCLGSVTVFSAQTDHKKFDVQSGMILYTISGGGKLTEDVNLTIQGKGKLRFKDWGVVALIEEDFEEIISGALQNIETIQRCEKLEDKQRFDVDFKTKKIYERKMPKGNFHEYITKDLLKTGQEEIAGYTCDIWEGVGVRKCIYKGIPLLVEHYLLGTYYRKKASSIQFNIDPSAAKCSIPNFPIQKFALFKTHSKTKSKKLPQEFSKILISVGKDMQKQLSVNEIEEDNFTPEQKRVWLDQIGQNVFEKQKLFLPQFLLSMKKARVCLAQADNWIQANVCVEDVVQLKSQLTKDRENNIEQWKGEEKEQVLNDFDEHISLLESRMQCIRSSKNITDLSSCMK
jgi:hypothetical protein